MCSKSSSLIRVSEPSLESWAFESSLGEASLKDGSSQSQRLDCISWPIAHVFVTAYLSGFRMRTSITSSVPPPICLESESPVMSRMENRLFFLPLTRSFRLAACSCSTFNKHLFRAVGHVKSTPRHRCNDEGKDRWIRCGMIRCGNLTAVCRGNTMPPLVGCKAYIPAVQTTSKTQLEGSALGVIGVYLPAKYTGL